MDNAWSPGATWSVDEVLGRQVRLNSTRAPSTRQATAWLATKGSRKAAALSEASRTITEKSAGRSDALELELAELTKDYKGKVWR